MRQIRAGRLKDILDIQTNTRTTDQYGGPVDSWVTSAADVPCEIRPKSASEFYKGAGENVHGVFEIRFRFEEGLIEENNQLVDTTTSPNRIFDIQSIVDPGNWNSQTIIMALQRKWPIRD